ncbi:ADP-ribosylglycohydrolase family protein [Erysipelothrix sp. HDW6C]|uniref:ADP-ribosylglycohydrolase family protein n=1 Tax=Erysipelothrix sp. HDW6C TaxID=2714930 RepID=UPI00140BCF8B|nr:ADP-ribosylglycohydrolase family protein [Erysipelothrix sp. HDW6C]
METGRGWVAEEAIAIYVALRYQDDIISAYEVAIYHDEDGDSTGSILGNILGTYLSFEALPKAMVAALDIGDITERLINDAP